MLKILLLSRYDSIGASSRLRTLQYIPLLEENGFEIHITPFFNNECMQAFYKTNKKGVWEVSRSYYLRLKALFNAKKYDLVWVEKETLPWFPGVFENLLNKMSVPYIVDYDDALFHNYDKANNYFVRNFWGKKLIPLIKNASAIIVGNSYLQKYMLNNSAKRVDIIPTVIDLNRYAYTPEPENAEFRIGWIGTPKTSKYLEIVKEPLESLAKKRRIKLVTIGAPELTDYKLPIEQHAWSEETEAELLKTINIGIMPLPNGFWEQGKCGYKLIQYMACGRAVLATPVGVNKEIVKDENGLLSDPLNNNWSACIESLLNNELERKKMGLYNRKQVEETYSVQSQFPKLINIFKDCLL